MKNMLKNKGKNLKLTTLAFTLIELLAVIVILAVIALIATPIILGIVEDTKRDAYLRDCEMIEHAAELYVTSELKGLVDTKEHVIPMSQLNKYINNITEEKLEESVIVKNIDGELSYHYTGRDSNPYDDYKTLKEVIEKDSEHIVKNTKVNGVVVNKVIGTKATKYDQKNYVWYSGQLWQVLETNDNNNSIKLVTADSLTSISYGETNDWNTSWVKTWLDEEFLSILERKDIIVDTVFCLDEPNITESVQEEYGGRWLKKVTGAIPINACVNSVTEQVGLMTVEDYAYALNGTVLNYLGNNFLDDDNLTWLMTPYKGATKEGNTNTKHMWVTWYNNPSYLTVLTGLNASGTSTGNYDFSITNNYGLGIRPVISIKDDIKILKGEGTKKNPFILITEDELNKGSKLNHAKVGQYVYLDESNNPNAFTSQTVLTGASYTTTKDKVMYRIVKINDDGTIKLERADILRNLPNTIAINSGYVVPYYYNVGATANESCLYDETGAYFDQVTGKWYTTGCTNHNYFQPNQGNGEYAYTEGENVGYFLNNASNSFYNWYSTSTKQMIEETEWNLPVDAHGKDYKTTLYNEDEIGTYPSTTTDGVTNAYVGLPQWGEIYSGNDLNYTYWYINRWQASASTVSNVNSNGYAYYSNASHSWSALRPVIRLKSNIVIGGGEGTISNPYTIGM